MTILGGCCTLFVFRVVDGGAEVVIGVVDVVVVVEIVEGDVGKVVAVVSEAAEEVLDVVVASWEVRVMVTGVTLPARTGTSRKTTSSKQPRRTRTTAAMPGR